MISDHKRFHDVEQPVFLNPDSWLEHYRDSLAAGRTPWPPWSRDELLLAEREGLLEQNPQWLPGQQGLRMLGLPPFFGRGLPAYGDRFRERLLTTIHTVPEFSLAIKRMIGA